MTSAGIPGLKEAAGRFDATMAEAGALERRHAEIRQVLGAAFSRVETLLQQAQAGGQVDNEEVASLQATIAAGKASEAEVLEHMARLSAEFEAQAAAVGSSAGEAITRRAMIAQATRREGFRA